MFKFNAKEVETMESEIEKLYANNAKRIKEHSDRVFSKMEENGIDSKKRLAEIASQEKWNKESYGGDCWFAPNYHGPFNGGLQANVFSNMFDAFGLYAKYTVPGYLIPCILLARAMAEDEKTNLYVRAALAGSKKVNDIKHGWDERSELIYRVLTSIID